MREQIELTFKIGFPSQMLGTARIERFEEQVADAASLICGGCETAFSTGWWKEDGASHAERFTGKLEAEATLTIKVSCEIAKSQEAYRHIKNAIIVYARDGGVKTNWVHVQRVPFIGMHFSVEDAYLSAVEVRDVVSPGTRFAHS